MKQLLQIIDSIVAFLIDTFFSWCFAAMLLIPIFGTILYRGHSRRLRQFYQIMAKIDKPEMMTVEQWEKKRR